MNEGVFILKKIIEIRSNTLFKSAGIYTITSIINSAIPFFLLPILTRYLSPADYGMVSMFGVLVSFISPFIGLSGNGAIARMYYEKDTVDIREYIANTMYILLASTIIVSAAFYLFADIISKASSVPMQILWMAIAISFAQFMTKIVLTLWQIEVKPIKYGIFQISQTMLNLLLSIFFVVLIKLEWKGRIYAQLITIIVFMIISTIILLKNNWLKFNYNSRYIKNALNFGIPMIPHALGAIFITMTDRVFITNMVGIETTGVYTVGYQIGTIINLLATSFNSAYVPWLYQKLKENKYTTKIKIVKFTYFYFIVIVLLALILGLLAPIFLTAFLGKSFNESSVYVIWIALGYAFNGMYFMVTNYIFYEQKTSYLAIVTFASAIINIILNYIFIKKNGAIGAAQATTIIYFVQFLLTWILASRVYKMPWNLKKEG